MAIILKGKAVSDKIISAALEKTERLKALSVIPKLVTLRVGEREADIAYENSIIKKCRKLNVEHFSLVLPENVGEDSLIKEIEKLNEDDKVHGVLIFRPLPGGIDEDRVRNTLCDEKDIDGITDLSLAAVFTDTKKGYPPCTAKAVMEILKYYDIELRGKKVTVIGRSLVVGRPLAMMLLKEDATVKICHSKSLNLKKEVMDSDIVITALGRAKMIDETYLKEGQVVIDVGINTDEAGELCGDVDFERIVNKVEAVTPVPGGVGAVTGGILISNVIRSASLKEGVECDV